MENKIERIYEETKGIVTGDLELKIDSDAVVFRPLTFPEFLEEETNIRKDGLSLFEKYATGSVLERQRNKGIITLGHTRPTLVGNKLGYEVTVGIPEDLDLPLRECELVNTISHELGHVWAFQQSSLGEKLKNDDEKYVNAKANVKKLLSKLNEKEKELGQLAREVPFTYYFSLEVPTDIKTKESLEEFTSIIWAKGLKELSEYIEETKIFLETKQKLNKSLRRFGNHSVEELVEKYSTGINKGRLKQYEEKEDSDLKVRIEKSSLALMRCKEVNDIFNQIIRTAPESIKLLEKIGKAKAKAHFLLEGWASYVGHLAGRKYAGDHNIDYDETSHRVERHIVENASSTPPELDAYIYGKEIFSKLGYMMAKEMASKVTSDKELMKEMKRWLARGRR